MSLCTPRRAPSFALPRTLAALAALAALGSPPRAQSPSLLADINATVQRDDGSDPQAFNSFGNVSLFVARRTDVGRELWRSDGTSLGTQMLLDANPGTGGVNVSPWMFTFQGKLYYSFDDGTHGQELWATDGTPQGTGLIKDIYGGRLKSSISGQMLWNDKLYFSALTPGAGKQLWESDGTSAGTRRLLPSGVSLSSHWSQRSPLLVPVGEKLAFFGGRTASEGDELWATDGTTSGTRRWAQLVPGAAGSKAFPRGVIQGRLVFSAETDEFGEEPWLLDPGASAVASGVHCGRYPLHLTMREPRLGTTSSIRMSGFQGLTGLVLCLGATDARPRVFLRPCFSYLDPATLLVLEGRVSQGAALHSAMPIPSDLGLVGLRACLQFFAISDAPRATLASQGLFVRIGRP
jgi:ELWxxDGT repeat protein